MKQTPVPTSKMPAYRPRLPRLELALAAGLTALLDQLSKSSAHVFLQGRPSLPLIDGLVHLTYTQNTGAAFGLLRDYTLLLSLLSLLFLLAIILVGANLPLSSRAMRLALGAGVGGALSNLLDRFTKGYVIDFIDFRVWPVFNLADVAIVVGLGVVCFRFAFRRAAPSSPTDRRSSPERTDNNAP